MCQLRYWRALLLFGIMLLGVPSAARAQQGQPPYLGMPITSPNQAAPASDGTGPIGQSSVSNLDSSVPQNTVRLRFDAGYNMPRPTRAEYFMAMGGTPFTPGLPIPEPRINSYQELPTYLEFAPLPFFSTFIETPVRWINPQVNDNTYGFGDINLGFKLCTWQSEDFVATLQLRAYDPTAQKPGLGTHHWTI